MMHFLKTWSFWLGSFISLFCLWLAFRGAPLGELVQLVFGANLFWLLVAIGLQLLCIVSRAQRWVVLLSVEGRLGDSFWVQSVGFLFTNVFPLRMGEPARVLLMSERCVLPVMQVAASAIVERLLDVATNVCILILVLPWMQAPPLMKRAGLSFGMLVLAGVGILLLVVRFSRYSERLLFAICSYFPFLPAEKIVARWRELVSGFLPLTRGRIALQASCWSLVSWAFSIAVYWSVIRAFQPAGRVVEAAFMMVALSFAAAVPSSPGFVGVFQLVGQQALVLPFGAKYTAGNALAITMTAHLIYYVFTTALGVLGMWCLGGSFLNLGQVMTGNRLVQKTPSKEIAQ